MANVARLIFLLAVLVVTSAGGKKILLLTVITPSHMLQLGSIGDALVRKGHDVSMVVHAGSNVPASVKKAGVKIIRYETQDEIFLFETQEFQDRMTNISRYGSPIETVRHLTQFIGAEAMKMIDNNDLMVKLRAENFDFAMVDGSQFSRYLFVIAYRLGIHYGAVTPLLPYDMFSLTTQIPHLVPSPISVFTMESTFLQRLKTFSTVSMLNIITTWIFDENAMKMVCEEPFTSLKDLAYKSHIWLVDLDDLVDVPKPLPPNVINVGGLSTGPPLPLPLEFKTFADEAVEGLIVITFGGTIGYLPRDYLDNILLGLALVRYKVVFRQKTKPSVKIPPNVKLVPWLPQNDLLGHPNTKLFITHCGSNGQHEAVYHGVPMLGLPIHADQLYNAARLTAKGYGTSLQIDSLEPTEFAKAINLVIENDTYRETIQRASRVFRSRPMPPRERAAFWVQHVMDHGSEHLQSYTSQLSWYEILLIDILGAILFVALIGLISIKACCCFMFRQLLQKSAKEKVN